MSGRPAIPLERVEERAWWPDVLIGNASGMNPQGEAERRVCWVFDRPTTSVYFAGKQMHIRRVLVIALRPDFAASLERGARLAQLDSCVKATHADDSGCINPWHQVVAMRVADARREFVLRNRDWDYRPRTFQTALGGVALVGEVVDELFVRAIDDDEFLGELLDAGGLVRMSGDAFERFVVSPMVAVELDKMLADEELDAAVVEARVAEQQAAASRLGKKAAVLANVKRIRAAKQAQATGTKRGRAKASAVRPRPAKR